jgi:hypothetical protein
MRRKALRVFLAAVFVLGTALLCEAGMESENYQITTSTMSGGGGAMGSTNYQMNSTLGQPSPLMDPADQPGSESYRLFPGFWYTLDLGLGCYYDLDGDGDVDGKDLAEIAAGFGGAYDPDDLMDFALEFGGDLCP